MKELLCIHLASWYIPPIFWEKNILQLGKEKKKKTLKLYFEQYKKALYWTPDNPKYNREIAFILTSLAKLEKKENMRQKHFSI